MGDSGLEPLTSALSRQAGSPAVKAGIKAGDVIVSVNGEAVNDARTLAKRISALTARVRARTRAPPRPHATLGHLRATWRSGYAAACKAVYTGSIPVVASRAVWGVSPKTFVRIP